MGNQAMQEIIDTLLYPSFSFYTGGYVQSYWGQVFNNFLSKTTLFTDLADMAEQYPSFHVSECECVRESAQIVNAQNSACCTDFLFFFVQ